ncbi:MAG TPA: iron ABC transporter permease [Chloroflexota bacterium]|jgi:iron(III) transport system permease protein|nr:iron ABC transporter permease [Chloroflexota bacterium]
MASAADAGVLDARTWRDWRPQWNLQNVLGTVLLGLLSLFVVYPVVLILLQSIQITRPGEPMVFGLDGWRAIFNERGLFSATMNTLGLTLARQAISLPIAILIAWLIARTDLPGRNVFEFLFWLAFFLPSLTVTLSWIMVLDPEFGLFNQLIRRLGVPAFNIYSFWGITWVHIMASSITVKVMLLTPVLRNMNAAFEEASRVAGASPITTLARIVVPVVLPAVLAIELLAVTRSLEAFEIEQVLGAPIGLYVLSTTIYDMLYQQIPRYDVAAALGVIMLVSMLALVYLQKHWTAGRRFTTVTGQYQVQVLRLGRWRWVAFAGLVVVLALIIAVPLVFSLVGTFMQFFGFFTGAWTLKHWETALKDRFLIQSLQNTLILAFGTAIAAVLVHSLIAYVIVRTRFFGRGTLDTMSWLPFTVPGILLSLGLLGMFLRTPGFRPLYGSMIVLVIAGVVAIMPLAVQIVRSNLLQLGAELEEASWLTGGNWLQTYRRIVLPLISPTLVVVGLISFIGAARNIAQVALLSNTATRPLSIMQLDYMADHRLEVAAVIACLIMFMTLGLALAARAFGYKTASG